MKLEVLEHPLCAFCPGENVIKHGKTTGGNIRLRCRDCSKTWVPENLQKQKPDFTSLAFSYLEGSTVRELVALYRTSPLRINQKIRKFLNALPHWESYLDRCADNRTSQIVHLISKSFSCKATGTRNNQMHLAMAVDGLSSLVLGYETGTEDNAELWKKLIARLKERGIKASTFLTNSSSDKDGAVTEFYPEASLRLNFHKVRREQEIECCLANKLPVKIRLVNDAVRFYNTLDNQTLNNYLRSHHNTDMNQCLRANSDEFLQCVDNRCGAKNNPRLDDLEEEFKSRFEKFHMLKSDPAPILNGWIALQMLKPLEFGFNRLSLYKQTPCSCSFENFANGQMPCLMKLEKNSRELKSFVNEVGTRVLQLPLTVKNCEISLQD